MVDATLLIHGPLAGHCLDRTAAAVRAARGRSDLRLDRIVVSTYPDDADRAGGLIREHLPGHDVGVVTRPDVANPGFYNVNRQVSLVNAGLEAVDESALVIKLRIDQCVDFRRLGRVLESLRPAAGSDRILTTNCYTRADRLYHPSDMFLCGGRGPLRAYYSLPYQSLTHMDCVLAAVNATSRGRLAHGLPGAPEELLFRHYLGTRGWQCRDTPDDSLAAIRRHCHVVNTWDIGLTWTKRRSPWRPAHSVILPYAFKARPFPGGPVERARCLSRHEVQGGPPTLADVCHLLLAAFLWKVGDQKPFRPGYLRHRMQLLNRSIRKRLPRRHT